MKIQSLILSDLHIGNPWCRQDLIAKVIDEYEFENLFLVGDFIHGDMKQAPWDINLITTLIRAYNTAKRIIYIPGNHDDFLTLFNNHQIGKLIFTEEYYYDALNGKRYLITHGHQYNYINGIKKPRLKFWIGSKLYKFYLKFKSSPLKWIKNKFFKRPISFSKWARKLGKSRNVDGVIVGHVHEPRIDTSKKVDYINIGGFVENMAYVIETLDGNFELKYTGQ